MTRKTRRKLKTTKTGKVQKLVDCCRKDLKKELKKQPAERLCARLMNSVERAFTRTRKLFTQIDPQDTLTIHRTRVSFKKFRYMAEALAELLPGIDADYTCRLREYQGVMGEIQDREVLMKSFREWVIREEPKRSWARRVQAQLETGGRKLVRAYLAQADKLLAFWPLPPNRQAARPAKEQKSPRPGPEANGSLNQQ